MSTSFPPIIHMFSTGRFRRTVCFCFLLLTPLARGGFGETGSVYAQAAADSTLYRVFLLDGSTLLSYGEFARVADRIVISVPLGGSAANPDLHLLSFPADSVDWEKTDAYADSVRASRYAGTRGPDDFALLNGAVTTALTDIALTKDPNRKIAMAAEARHNVTKWVAEHYGYRAEDVARMAAMFDDVVAETRAAAGIKNFDLSLIANLAAPPSVPLLPEPTLRESVEQALRGAVLAPDATERISLLRAIDRVLADAAGSTSAPASPGGERGWLASVRPRVAGALAVEERASRGYDLLTRETLQAADRHARQADVGGVERVIRRALSEDDRLGQRRPQEMASLLATLDGKLDAARRLRLARDTWEARADQWRRYNAAMREPLAVMRASRGALDQIRRLAGPSRASLARLAAATARALALITPVVAPGEGGGAHGLLKNAVQMASRAAASRQRAIVSGDMPTAWEASAAAAGALMLFDRATEDLKALQSLPKAPR
jgi:hypothetical protein